MKNIKIKRIGAYFIDLLIISVIVSLLSNINFLNPMKSKYQKVYEEYSDYYKEITESLSNTTTFDTKSIMSDEYINYMYKLQYYGTSYILIEIVVVIVLFHHQDI